jgi:hypothetical protein
MEYGESHEEDRNRGPRSKNSVAAVPAPEKDRSFVERSGGLHERIATPLELGEYRNRHRWKEASLLSRTVSCGRLGKYRRRYAEPNWGRPEVTRMP